MLNLLKLATALPPHGLLRGLKQKVRALGVTLAMVVFAQPASALLDIQITEGVEGALPIAVIPFGWDGKNQAVPQRVGEIIASNLRRSGQFAPIDEKDLVARPTEGSEIRFENWRTVGVDNIVVGQVRATGPGVYAVQFQLFNVFKGEQIAGYSFPAREAELRAVAHHISDIVFEKLTGVRGAFGTRIAYVVAEGPVKKRTHRLLVADSDGHNAQTVLESPHPVMSPSWSPDGKQLAYVSFEKKAGHIYVQSLETGTRKVLSEAPGINGAPSWSRDGRQLALTLSQDGNPEIYVLDVASGAKRRVTRNAGIDTEPVWSHDNRSIYFTSDRGGRPQIYRVAANGGKAGRVTFEGKYNARPTVSPNGKQLAMVHGDGRRFRIALMELDTGALRILTDGKQDESPSFSPNGSMILFASQHRGRGVLSGVSVDGRVKQRLHLDRAEVREPAWSPYLN